MLLSVIVPVYNTAGEGKLEYCLNSLVSQTLEDMEIIAVDDCSTDDSWQILQRFEREYPGRFRAVHSEVNRKQGGAVVELLLPLHPPEKEGTADAYTSAGLGGRLRRL